MEVGSDVFIWGGVSHLEHGRVVAIRKEFERPFAEVRLRNKDGSLSRKRRTLVPVVNCSTLSDAQIERASLRKKRETKRKVAA
jgi:hypothetical protein